MTTADNGINPSTSRIGSLCFARPRVSLLSIVLTLLVCNGLDAFSTRASCHQYHDVRQARYFKTSHHQEKKKGGNRLQQSSIGGAAVAPLKVSSAASSGDLSNFIPNNVNRQQRQQQQTEASEIITKAKEEQILKDYRVPSVKDLLAFSIPAIGVWLCVPLLSMIDTGTVGLIAGTTSQAALMSAIAAINYSSKAMAFLFSGTTTMMAAAQEGDRHDGTMIDKPRTTNTLVGALQLSTLVGLGLGAAVFVFARQLLALIVGGGGGGNPTIMTAAMKYVRIRAIGFAAAGMLGSAQTACLSQKDIKMPLLATGICAMTNLCLDLILIRNPHPLIGGVAGAAWATTIAQYTAAIWSMKYLTTRHVRKQQEEVQQKTSSSAAGGSLFVSHSTRGFLAGRMSLRDLLKRPTRDITKGFSPYVIPVFTTQMGRCSASAAIDHVVSSSFGAVSMAANQILTSVYYGLVPVAESLSLAAQNFVPGITERDGGKPEEKALAMRRLLRSFVKAAGLCGLFLAAIMGTLPLYCGAFTTDGAVQQLVSAVVPLIFVTCLKHGLFCSSEGILLANKDMRFLGGQYGVYTLLIPYILLQVKKAALGGSSRVGLVTVWQIFLGYDLFRTALMMARIRWLEGKRASVADEQGNEHNLKAQPVCAA